MEFKIKRKSSLHARQLSSKGSKPVSAVSKKPVDQPIKPQNNTQQDSEIQEIIKRIQQESETQITPQLSVLIFYKERGKNYLRKRRFIIQREFVIKSKIISNFIKLKVTKAKKEGILEKAKTKQAKAQIKMAMNDPFLTGFKINQEVQEITPNEITGQLEYIDDSDVIDNIKTTRDPEDDLAKLRSILNKIRRMIKETKSNITDYIGDLYTLNGKVQECNGYFKETGQNHDEDIFQQFNTTFNKYMPGGNKNVLFKN